MMTRHPIPGMLPDSQADRSDHAFANISTTDSTQNTKSGAELALAQEILLLAMKAGQIQLENGAEIFRVEDTIMHICRAYGLHSVNTFVLSNGIFVSCGDETEPQFAKVQQIPVNNTNLRRVAEVNQLSRRIEEEKLSLETVRQELKRIEEQPGFPAALQIAVAGISGACFGVMFGGTPRDFVCSLLIGGLYQAYALYLGNPHFSRIVRSILGSAWITFLCILCYRFGPGQNFDAMIIGGIILMVPGVAFTNAIRDMADSDYIAGSVRMMDAILGFFCIAIGVGFVIALYGILAGAPLLP
ncbi:threonine/serine exporter family protein [Clostridium sp. OM02-18AC]|uniref:threonine/serine exporter family protein n=1 Tax=Clostridium sp. OM02-18AC TaxID=2292311 RepID=UPI001FAA3B2E|nr:threonine/serine exporter family protein [Clostridium sp. OM02-18AC]